MKAKAILDTSFLVEHFRKENVQGLFLQLNQYYHITFSSVVLMELLSGAYDRKERRLLEQIKRNFSVVTPTEKHWWSTGETLMKLRALKKIDPARMKGLLADVLIAVSARDIGAALITKNAKDFQLIKEVLDFKLIAV
ncbi:MAG: PIN domain-containing protein [Nitrospirae bacterium]|nr:PIN domain-containing protein [Nitrospirota bacterium]